VQEGGVALAFPREELERLLLHEKDNAAVLCRRGARAAGIFNEDIVVREKRGNLEFVVNVVDAGVLQAQDVRFELLNELLCVA
jgi:hypothetical protein